MKKRLLVLLMGCIMLAQTVPVFAQQSERLEEAILAVKSVIDIPSNMEINYTVNENGTDISWYGGDRSIFVELDTHNCILSYYSYDLMDADNNTDYFGDYAGECLPVAESFLKKILGDAFAQYRLIDTYKPTYSESIYFTYKQYVQDIPVDYNKIEIGINVVDKSVTNYAGNCLELINGEFPSAEAAITPEKAEEILMDGDGFMLCYAIGYNSNGIKNYLQYKNDNTYCIDAITGEKIEYQYSYSYAKNESTTEDAAGDYLSEYEQARVNELTDAMSGEEAFEIVKKYFPNVKDSTLERVNYSTSIYTDNAVINISGSGDKEFYADLDLITGEILSCYIYSTEAEGQPVSEDKAVKVALSLIDSMGVNVSDRDQYIYSTDDFGSANLYFRRMENGIPVENDGYYIDVDSNGDVYLYCRNYSNTEFAEFDGILEEREAFDSIAALADFGLKYIYIDENPVLAYGFDKNIRISPFTGERIDYNGEPYEYYDEKPEYTDLEGDLNRYIIELMADYGYYIADDEFKPNQIITEKEFYNYSKLYYDKAKTTDKKLTKNDVCKILVENAGYKKIAETQEIFMNKYKDVDDNMAGYVNIAVACGFMDVDGDSFNGESQVTRSQAAKYIYNYYQNK